MTGLAGTASAQLPVPGTTPGRSSLVSAGADSRLRYTAYTERGDILPDFSRSGFGGGGVALPVADVRETLEPQPGHGDDGPRIQAALDRVAELAPGADGLRGTVLLKHGAYRCGTVLR